MKVLEILSCSNYELLLWELDLQKIDKEYNMLGDDILENTNSSVPEISDYETWKVTVKVDGDKIMVEHRRYSGLEDLNLPPLD